MRTLNLPQDIKRMLDDFVSSLKNNYGDNLISVTLYGSAASGEYSKKNSNINIAIILKDTSIKYLKEILRFINKQKFMVINPVFFTEEYVKNSADVFPIEFLDMKENHIVIYGKDFLEDVSIDLKNLRFQCEQELKSKIINIKRLYLRTTDTAILKKLLLKSITSAIHIFRNVLRLKGRVPPYSKEDVLNDVARELTINTAPLAKILDAKNRNLRLNREEIDNYFASLIEALETAGDKVNQF